MAKEKGPTTFPSLEAFLKWAGHSGINFPLPNGKGWEVQLSKDRARITSTFYYVEGDPSGYGAPKIFGHLLPLGEEMVSGLIEVGPNGEIVNRRRVVEDDKLDENQKIAEVIIAQPDRVIEPVAVIISGEIENYSKDQETWNKATIAARDGVELMALQAVMAQIFE